MYDFLVNLKRVLEGFPEGQESTGDLIDADSQRPIVYRVGISLLKKDLRSHIMRGA